MPKQWAPRPTIQGISLFPLTLLLAFLLPWGALQASIPDHQVQLLQFTAAGHVLGFQSDGLYVASGDHMLHVSFIGTAGVMPEAAGIETDDSKVQPLTWVTYTDLWPGVSLRYEAIDGDITQSIWEIAPRGDVNQIQLRYNAPLEIAHDGSLEIRYETG